MPTIEEDISEMALHSIGSMYGCFVSWHGYITAELAKADMEKTEVEALITRKKVLIKDKHDNGSIEKWRLADLIEEELLKTGLLDDQIQKNAVYEALKVIANDLDLNARTLSREISRRKTQMELDHS